MNREEELEEGKKFNHRTALSKASREAVIQTQKNKITTFAWQAEDIKGVDPIIITHKLNVDPKAKPIQQKRDTLSQSINR